MRVRVALVIGLLGLAQCSGQTDANTGTSAGIVGMPAVGSKFARLKLGMSKSEVQDLIGDPTDQNSHMTGKAFIPYYFGAGTTQIDAHYKGEGVLTFDSRAVGSTAYTLVGVKVDRAERGYVQ